MTATKTYRVTAEDFQTVLDFYEAVAWELFEAWRPDEPDALLDEESIERIATRLANGRTRLDLAEWPQCPICRAVELQNQIGRDPCAICPVGSECWRNPEGAYERMLGALESGDPVVAYHGLFDAAMVIEAARDEALRLGGWIEVSDADV